MSFDQTLKSKSFEALEINGEMDHAPNSISSSSFVVTKCVAASTINNLFNVIQTNRLILLQLSEQKAQ